MSKNKKLNIQEYELPISLEEQKDGGYTAICSIWKDCYAQGETVEEAVNEISYVAASLIELYREEEMKIPLKLKNSEQKSSIFNLSIPVIVSSF